ncbi:hypothetical protein [Luteipulveratus halotolerans]|uniref:Uncharacterized protein n=1 Tax=Luteipulveratus halotolerans TaxID=1631356 RepID=A0A0L6CPJ1_9MICO|nr:hypothetical protein [Luteipulveratus halotolerans]KNX39679.1 hypothetical protein VV01_00125 [Luteipulveratus halotolerans]
MPEQTITVVFDVPAPTRERAAMFVRDLLAEHVNPVMHTPAAASDAVTCESWWFPERDLKRIDGNDRDPMHLADDI